MARTKRSAKEKNRKKKRKKAAEVVRDRHLLYSAAVQSVEADVDFFDRIFRAKRGRKAETLKEDFCGTAVLSCEWVSRGKERRAWGVDLDEPTLAWGREHWMSRLKGDGAERLTLVRDDVRKVTEPKVEAVAALNFSYGVFKTRDELRGYFEAARRSLTPDGILFIDAFGGQESLGEMTEKRKVPTDEVWSGIRVPRFTYVWEQKSFNPVDHRIVCRIHFKLADGTRLRNAFRYDWRLWTLPELQELMREAGFSDTEVYTEGWDDEADDTDGIFRRRKSFENQEGWVAYVVGIA